jgi:glucose-1-phosphate thymidylyltransferase
VIATLVRELSAAGFSGVTIVTGYLAEEIEGLLGNGAAFGVELDYVRQPVPDGSGDVVQRALAAGVEPPLLVVAADTVFVPGDLRRFAAAEAPGAVATFQAEAPEAAPAPVEVEDGRVRRIVLADPHSPVRAAPLWGIGRALLPHLEHLPGPPFELAVGFQRAIEAGEAIAAVEIGQIRDLTDPLDLVRENFPYLN